MREWSNEYSRSFVVYFHHRTGTHVTGTRNLRDKMALHPESWRRAAVLDTQLLNSENPEEKLEAAAPEFDGGKIVHGVMKNTETAPRLPIPFKHCNEKDFRAWLVPQIKRRVIELGKEPVADVYWRKENSRVDFFPEEMGVRWEDFSNPAHKQKFPERLNGWKCGEILREMTRKRLEQLGLDPDQHHVEDFNVKDVAARKKKNKSKVLRDFRLTQTARSPRSNIFHEAAIAASYSEQNYHPFANQEVLLTEDQDPLADEMPGNNMEIEETEEEDDLNTSTSSVR